MEQKAQEIRIDERVAVECACGAER